MNALDQTLANLASRGVERKERQPTRDTLFRTPAPVPTTKGDLTTQAAKSIIEAETEQRLAAVARLKQARLDKEATDGPTPPKKARRVRPE